MSKKSDLAKIARKQYYSKYPSFVLNEATCLGKSRQFIDGVRAAMAKVRFDDASLRLKRGDLGILMAIRKWGYAEALRILQSNGWDEERMRISATLMPGTILYGMMDKLFPSLLSRYVPFSMAIPDPVGREFIVSIQELSAVDTTAGHAYCSRNVGVVCIFDGQEKAVVFSHHAISRLQERLYPNEDRRSFTASGDIYAYLDGGSVVERISPVGYESPGGDQGVILALYVISSPGGFLNSYIPMELLGSVDRDRNNYYSLAGYLPSVLDNELLVAKTMLLPGMRGTPEHRAIQSLNVMDQQSAFEGLSRKVFDPRLPIDYGLLRFLHGQGIPQVVAKRKNRPRGMIRALEQVSTTMSLDSALDSEPSVAVLL